MGFLQERLSFRFTDVYLLLRIGFMIAFEGADVDLQGGRAT